MSIWSALSGVTMRLRYQALTAVKPGWNVLHLPSSPNIIELIGEKSEGVYNFRITTPDGTKYEFCEREHTQHSYPGATGREAASGDGNVTRSSAAAVGQKGRDALSADCATANIDSDMPAYAVRTVSTIALYKKCMPLVVVNVISR